MTIPYQVPEPTITKKEIAAWLKKKHLKKTKATVTRATNALRAEKQADSLPAGRDISFVSSDSPRKVVYGRAQLGGTISFLDIRGSNQYFDVIVTIATHEIDAIEKVFFDDAEVIFGASPDPRWSTKLIKPDGTEIAADHLIFMQATMGADDQAAIGDLIGQNPGKWTWDHKQSGCAGAYFIIVWNALVFGDGLPEISFQIRGKKVRDPRSGTTYWTSNASLCQADFLTNTRFGPGVPLSRIDDTSLSSAADTCDESVILAGGGTEARYTTNGWFTTDENYGRILERFVAATGGQSTYSNGKWKFWPAKWRTPSLTITEDDLRSSIKIQTLAERADIFNAVRGQFVSAAAGYIEVDYPAVKNSTYAGLDGGEIFENIDYHLVTSAATCQRLSKLEVERIRQGIQVEFLCSLKAFSVQVPENVYLTFSRYGWSAKPFEIVDCDFIIQETGDAPELLVSLTLRETAQGVFDWNYWEETTVDVAPNTNLPSPFSVPTPTSVMVEAGTDQLYVRTDGTVIVRAKVSWTAFSDFFLSSGGKVETQYRKTGDSAWADAPSVPASSTFLYVQDVQDGVYYDFRVRAVNAFGIAGPYVEVLSFFVVGKTAPPSNVPGLSSGIFDYGLQLDWTAITDVDLGNYEIREGPSWESSTFVTLTGKVTQKVLEIRAVGVYQFWIKAIDTSGNYSVVAAGVSVTISAPSIPAATHRFDGPNMVLDWDEAIGGSWAIDSYNIYYDDGDGPIFLATTKASALLMNVSWGGSRTFLIEPRDIYGNVGAQVAVDANVLEPNAVTNFRPEVIDNNVLLRWTAPTASTLPIARYRVKKGDSYDTADFVGDALATFVVIVELSSGTFTYWVEAIDTAGNMGPAVQTTAIVNEPPDYELLDDIALENGTSLNVIESPLGTVIGPFVTSQTWGDHFSTYLWNSPQDQIDAGFPYFIQPAASYGRWEKIRDLGTTLNNVLIHISRSREDLVGSVDVTEKLAFSTDGVAWTEVVGVSVLADAVRYYRYRLDMGVVP